MAGTHVGTVEATGAFGGRSCPSEANDLPSAAFATRSGNEP